MKTNSDLIKIAKMQALIRGIVPTGKISELPFPECALYCLIEKMSLDDARKCKRKYRKLKRALTKMGYVKKGIPPQQVGVLVNKFLISQAESGKMPPQRHTRHEQA